MCPLGLRHSSPLCQADGVWLFVLGTPAAADVLAQGYAVVPGTQSAPQHADRLLPFQKAFLADFCQLKQQDLGQPGANLSLSECLQA